MLVEPNKQMLGDTHLDAKENLAKLKEGNATLTEKRKIANQAEYENLQKALGRPLHPNVVIERIRKANPNIIVEQGGVKSAVAVRFVADGEKKYITGFYVDTAMPEYSAVLTDARGVAVREVRGWRTVLLALIKAGAMTLQQADMLFGIALGNRAEAWTDKAQSSIVTP